LNLMSEDNSQENKLVELLEELVKWTRVTSIPKVKELLEELVKNPEEKIAYSFSDGKRTTREVAEMAQTNKDTVSRLWRKWIKSGIAEPIAGKGGNRAKSVFSLEDFGIEVPSVSKVINKETVPVEDKKTVSKNDEEASII
jgi:predicted HTH transcriptional regulator